MQNISSEIKYKTARSGGKGGQNVNKVETMVEGYWNPADSALFTSEQKELIISKLAARINAEGLLQVKSQEERTQLANKAIVLKKMNKLVHEALKIPKARKATRPSKASIENRITTKKRNAEVKKTRQKPGKIL
ncbi:MAG: alternative ribosome rescue aminoacyl-tRNA hydrolase ArfB [Ferruginibacter sp.]